MTVLPALADPAEPRPAPRRLTVGRGWHVSRLHQAPSGAFEEVHVEEGARSVDPLTLFSEVDRVLRAGPATLLVRDRFLLRRRPGGGPGLHLLSHFVALAHRMGWQSDGAGTAEAHAAVPASDASAEQDERDCTLRLRRTAEPLDRLRLLKPSDAPAMRRLFEQVFGQEMSAAHWHWKYGEGRGRAVGLWRGDRLIAHYGGLTRKTLWFGQPARATQVGDVMVLPEANTALARKGPMHQVSASFLETQSGWGFDEVIGYGFPSDRHYRLAHRLGFYDSVDTIVRASWPAAEGSAAISAAEVAEALAPEDIVPGGRRHRAAARLWQRMATHFADRVIGVRDPAWLQQRYARRPGLGYDMLYLRRAWTRRPIGIVVMRAHADHLHVLDLVGEPAAFGALIMAARRRAAQLALPRIDCWITASQAGMLAGIDAAALTVEPLDITVPANAHGLAPIDELRGRWFLLAGDADFT